MNAEARLHEFPGGLYLDGHKEESTASPIATLPLCDEFILPLEQHLGEPAEPVVAPGERVRKGQCLARPSAFISAGLHAPTSGTVTAIEERPIPHPSGMSARCIVLTADGRDESLSFTTRRDFSDLTPEQILERVQDAGVVGLGGAVFPTAVKLAAEQRGIDTLILNGAECEPYISCDEMLMRERPGEIVSGTRIMLQALSANRALLAVEDDKPRAAAALADAIAESGDGRLQLVRVPARYPQGGERQLIQTLTGREVPHDGLPLDLGLVCQNVGTAAAVHRTVLHGEPLLSRIVTVTGPGVAHPQNFEVRLGTPFAAVIAAAGGYTGEQPRLIMGGPMMGFAIRTDSVPVVKATNCILVLNEARLAPRDAPMPCIRCGDCAGACPAGLLPQQLFWHAQAGDMERVQDYDLFDCIECGCCDLVCPSHIPLAGWFRYAKTEIWGKEAERARSDIARRRHEARQARLEHERAEREERRRRKQEALKNKDAKSEIAAALERAKQKKGQD